MWFLGTFPTLTKQKTYQNIFTSEIIWCLKEKNYLPIKTHLLTWQDSSQVLHIWSWAGYLLRHPSWSLPNFVWAAELEVQSPPEWRRCHFWGKKMRWLKGEAHFIEAIFFFQTKSLVLVLAFLDLDTPGWPIHQFTTGTEKSSKSWSHFFPPLQKTSPTKHGSCAMV